MAPRARREAHRLKLGWARWAICVRVTRKPAKKGKGSVSVLSVRDVSSVEGGSALRGSLSKAERVNASRARMERRARVRVNWKDALCRCVGGRIGSAKDVTSAVRRGALTRVGKHASAEVRVTPSVWYSEN